MRIMHSGITTVVLALMITVNASATIIWVDPSVQSGMPGDLIVINLWADTEGDRGLYNWVLDLTFDPLALDFVSAAEGGFLASGGDPTYFYTGVSLPGSQANIGGTILGANPGVVGIGLLATLTFNVIGNAGDISMIQLINGYARDDLGEIVFVELVGGQVGIIPEPSTLGLLLVGSGLLWVKHRRHSYRT